MLNSVPPPSVSGSGHLPRHDDYSTVQLARLVQLGTRGPVARTYNIISRRSVLAQTPFISRVKRR